MWPFDDPKNQIPAIPPTGMHQDVPKLGGEPNGDPYRLKVQELEARIFGLELAVIELAKALGAHRQQCSLNFIQLDKNFSNLVAYVMRPRTQIMGDQRDIN